MMSKKMPMAFMVNFLISREQKQLLQRRRGARQRAPFSGQVIADTGRSLLPLAAKSLLIHAKSFRQATRHFRREDDET